LKQASGSQLVKYIQSISGKVVSDKERANLLELAPNPSMDDQEFMTKAELFKAELNRIVEAKRSALEGAGKVIQGAEAPPAANYDIGTVNGKKYMFEKGTKKNLGLYKGP
jgi:hypothetical protein